MEKITSVQNTKIKMLVQLQSKSGERRDSGLFVVEGRRELEHCLEGGYRIRTVFVCPEIIGEKGAADVVASVRGADNRLETPSDGLLDHTEASPAFFEITRQVYEKAAYRGSTEGVIAIVESKSHTLADLRITKAGPLVIVLESVEKPGNLGAVLRSADAAAVDAVIVCDPLTDIYNPNLLRSSIGAAFTVPIAVCTTAEAVNWLKERNFSILTAQLQDSELYYDTDMTGPTAIVMGTESTGLSDSWRRAASAHIRIPMLGRLDSLNVSVSAAILLFEAVRQRENKTTR